MMDAIEQFLWKTKFTLAAGVLGRADGAFALIDLGPGEMDVSMYTGRGFTFCGVLGFADGQCSVKSEPTMEAMGVMAAAALQFAEVVAARLKNDGGALEWLKRLADLPDHRDN